MGVYPIVDFIPRVTKHAGSSSAQETGRDYVRTTGMNAPTVAVIPIQKWKAKQMPR